MSKATMATRERISDRSARIGVVGMGYVGLPLAIEFARAGYKVTGIDVDSAKVAGIRAGKSHIKDVRSEEVAEQVKKRRLTAQDTYKGCHRFDAIVICVPTPLGKTKDPDISYIVSAVDQIGPQLREGQLIVLESTTYPGTTEEVMRPRLEQGGLKAGKDFFLAFSPERVDPGNTTYTTHNTPKVVGGTTRACTEVAAHLYGQAIEQVHEVSSTQVAEMIKLLENTFRAVNIGMVNEIVLMCEKLGIDAWEVIDGAATKPFGFMRFYPGPGIGGHCIPLGVTYKKDTGDVQESPALDVMRLLGQRGAKLSYHDPFTPRLTVDGDRTYRCSRLSKKLLSDADLVLVITDHSTFDYAQIVRDASLILDTRNATRDVRSGRSKIRKL
jgi:UDP-N-acetyl-D-glucosamine dehydrogenase